MFIFRVWRQLFVVLIKVAFIFLIFEIRKPDMISIASHKLFIYLNTIVYK